MRQHVPGQSNVWIKLTKLREMRTSDKSVPQSSLPDGSESDIHDILPVYYQSVYFLTCQQ